MTARPHRLAVRPLVRDVLAIEGLDPALTLDEGLPVLTEALRRGGVTVISGAGMSTASGIPDYRGPTGRARNATPMHYDEFIASPQAQRRYWARAYAGWSRMGEAHPNAGHRAITALQQAGRIAGVITQNVDGLHHRAGSDPVIDLHGSLDRVVCLRCRTMIDRVAVQDLLRLANPDFDPLVDIGDDAGEVRPDGDLSLRDAMVESFRTVNCPTCGDGPLKPDVVFFGESVGPGLVDRCTAWVQESSTLLVLGSSLAVMSAYRFVRLAHRLDVPVMIVNQGPTRGDREAQVRIGTDLVQALTGACGELGVHVGR